MIPVTEDCSVFVEIDRIRQKLTDLRLRVVLSLSNPAIHHRTGGLSSPKVY